MEAAIKALSDAFGKDVVLFSQSDLSGFQSHVKKWKRDNVPFSMVAWEDPSLVTFDKAGAPSEEPESEPSDDDEIENEINQKMRSASVVDQIVLKLSHERFFNTLKKCANKYDAASLMLRYSHEMEDEDQEMSTQLLARAQELLND